MSTVGVLGRLASKWTFAGASENETTPELPRASSGRLFRLANIPALGVLWRDRSLEILRQYPYVRFAPRIHGNAVPVPMDFALPSPAVEAELDLRVVSRSRGAQSPVAPPFTDCTSCTNCTSCASCTSCCSCTSCSSCSGCSSCSSCASCGCGSCGCGSCGS